MVQYRAGLLSALPRKRALYSSKKDRLRINSEVVTLNLLYCCSLERTHAQIRNPEWVSFPVSCIDGCHVPSYHTNRNAKQLAAAELREWDLQIERPPVDEVRFWKLTAEGAIDAVTTPDALFARRRPAHQQQYNHQLRQQQQQQKQQQQQHQQQPQQRCQRLKPEFLSSGGVQCTNTTNTPSKGSSIIPDAGDSSGADRKSAQTEELEEAVSTVCGDLPCGVDRFGRKIIHCHHPHEVSRSAGPPVGTLEPMGWGWGGEFRIGTGRDGFEVSPKPLHPDFKVKKTAYRCYSLGCVSRLEGV